MQLSCGVARALSRSLELAAFARWISVVVAVSRCFSQPLSFCASFSVFFPCWSRFRVLYYGPSTQTPFFLHTYIYLHKRTYSFHAHDLHFPHMHIPPHTMPIHPFLSPPHPPRRPYAVVENAEAQMPCSQVSSGRYVQNAKPGMSLSLKRCSGSLGGKRGRKIFNALDLTLVISRARC